MVIKNKEKGQIDGVKCEHGVPFIGVKIKKKKKDKKKIKNFKKSVDKGK